MRTVARSGRARRRRARRALGGRRRVRRRRRLPRAPADRGRATSRCSCSATSTARSLPFVERECSIQRRHQKVVEETPSLAVTPALRRRMTSAAAAVARAVGYTNAGTIEFLLDEDGRFYFLEMNTRLQVEHPITEMVTGVDLVHWQIRIARGERLDSRSRHACWRRRATPSSAGSTPRIPTTDFLPSPGRIRRCARRRAPASATTAAPRPGSTCPIFYDPMISKLIAWAEDRPAAIARMRRALGEYVVAGIKTTVPFFAWLLAQPDFLAGRFHTTYLDEVLKSHERPAVRRAGAATTRRSRPWPRRSRSWRCRRVTSRAWPRRSRRRARRALEGARAQHEGPALSAATKSTVNGPAPPGASVQSRRRTRFVVDGRRPRTGPLTRPASTRTRLSLLLDMRPAVRRMRPVFRPGAGGGGCADCIERSRADLDVQRRSPRPVRRDALRRPAAPGTAAATATPRAKRPARRPGPQRVVAPMPGKIVRGARQGRRRGPRAPADRRHRGDEDGERAARRPAHGTGRRTSTSAEAAVGRRGRAAGWSLQSAGVVDRRTESCPFTRRRGSRPYRRHCAPEPCGSLAGGILARVAIVEHAHGRSRAAAVRAARRASTGSAVEASERPHRTSARVGIRSCSRAGASSRTSRSTAAGRTIGRSSPPSASSISLDWSTALRPQARVSRSPSVELTDWQMLVEKWPDGHNFPRFTRERDPSRAGPRRFTATLQYLRAWRGQFAYEDHETPWSVVAPNIDHQHHQLCRSYHGEATFTGGIGRRFRTTCRCGRT